MKEYWIVIPEEKEVEVYILKDEAYQLYKTYTKVDILESPSLKRIKNRVKGNILR